MKTLLKKLFHWQLSSDTVLALVAGSIVIGLSAMMLPFNTRLPWIGILIRDIGQICLVGILLPLICVRRSSLGWAAFGFNFRRWPVYLVINLVLGFLLLRLFLSESPPPAGFRLNAQTLWSAAYVMLALGFELVFFYAFLRTQLERAFGVVPAIVLTALFYSFHHVGFQPEYSKLFFVGLIYATIFRIGNSVWLIYPFFLGVGGLYDVLIQSRVVSSVRYPEIRTVYLTVIFVVISVWLYRKSRMRQIKEEDEALC